MPNETIKEVKGFENKFQEEGEVIGFTSINVYEACTNYACYHKKLVNKECPTCHRQYSSETENISQRSAVCNIITLVNVNALAKARTYWLRQFQRYG